jgi:trigger factor
LKVSIQETSATVRTLDVSMPQDALKEAFDKKVTKYRKEVQIKGFRPGQVPKAMILSRFGDMIRQEALDETINKVVREELTKAGIDPVAPGKLDNFKDDRKEDISFRITVEVDPPVEIKGYQDLGLSVPEVMISEVEVQEEIDHLMRMWSKDQAVDRASVKGDMVVGSYLEVVIDGEARELPENREFRSLVGESQSPGFDEGLVGVSKGEKKDILFVYPADHKDEAYRGKNAKFSVEITDVREMVAPEMDAEFFTQIGMKDMEELREKVTDSVLGNKTRQAKSKVQNEAIDKLIELNAFEVPQARIADLVKRTLNRGKQDEDEMVEPTAEQLEGLTPGAIREIKKFRILEFISNTEKLKPTQAQVDARIQEMADAYHVDFESLKANFRQSGRIVNLREEIKFDLALDYIVGVRANATAE